MFRFRLGGKPARDMGLGGFPATTLSDARQKAHEARRLASGRRPYCRQRRRSGPETAGRGTRDNLSGMRQAADSH